MKVMLRNVPLSFPTLFVPTSVEEGQTKYYSVTLPIEPNSPNHKAITAAIDEAAKEAWGGIKNKKGESQWKEILEACRAKGDISFVEAPKTDKNGDVYDGFEGMFTARCSRPEKDGPPKVFDGRKDDIMANDSRIYSGAICNVQVDIWALEPRGKGISRRVSLKLLAVQYVKEGEAFGGGARASKDDFEEIEEADSFEADADDLG